MIVDCAHYCDGRRQHDGPMDLDRAATVYKDNGAGFVWLGLFEPTLEEMQKVQARSTVKILREQLDSLSNELNTSESALQTFREKHDVVSLPDTDHKPGARDDRQPQDRCARRRLHRAHDD